VGEEVGEAGEAFVGATAGEGVGERRRRYGVGSRAYFAPRRAL